MWFALPHLLFVRTVMFPFYSVYDDLASHTGTILLILAEWANTRGHCWPDWTHNLEWEIIAYWMSGTERGTVYDYINDCAVTVSVLWIYVYSKL